MTAFSIAASLLFIFLILDRVQNIYNRRRQAAADEQMARLDVLRIVAKEELHRTADPEALHRWTGRLLVMMGYTEVNTAEFNEDRGYDFTCFEKGRPVYVSCMLSKVEAFEEPVSRTAVQKLVGAMVGDRVKKGLIITTGELSDEARQYIEKLPVSCKVAVWDGEKLMNNLSELRKAKLEPLLES